MAKTERSKSKTPSLIDKLIDRMVKTGMTKRKATEVAKAVAPVARATVKKELETKANAPARKPRAKVGTALTEEGEIDPSAPAVSVNGGKNVDPLRVVMGLTSGRSYIAVASKGEDGFIAVRKLHDDSFKVKFYPHQEYWEFDYEKLTSLGLTSHLHRNIYDRYFSNKANLDQLLRRVEAMKPPKNILARLFNRFKVLSLGTIDKAFTKLYTYSYSGSYASQSVAASL